MRTMRLLRLPVLGVACLLAFAHLAHASQSSPAAAASPDAPISVRLDNASIALTGPWKFAPGDSPLVNGSLLWASPTFDDTAWTNMDLHSASAIDAAYGNSGYVTGWTARGFPHLADFAWYRIRIHLENAPGPLALKMPDHFDDAYQIFANGHFVGECGKFTARGAVSYRSRPLAFSLPAPDAHGDILVAIRFYMKPANLIVSNTNTGGGMHQAPVFGLQSQIESILAQAKSGRILGVVARAFFSFFILIAAIAAFWLWLLDRPHTTYLWLTFSLVFLSLTTFIDIPSVFTFLLTENAGLFTRNFFFGLSLVCWAFFWRRWFQLPRNGWLEGLILSAGAVAVLCDFFLTSIIQVSLSALQYFADILFLTFVLLGAMLFVGLYQGAKKDRPGALVALLPILLLTISLFDTFLLMWFGIRTAYYPFGVGINIGLIAQLLLVLVIGVLVARRFLRSQVNQQLERQAVEQELEQARELQQHVLIPEPVTSALFTVETAYHPALTVGGDFFQVIQHPDGSLLIVVGDVSGKGMPAAMLVAVLVGAIRTRADATFDPAAILHTLNDRMLGRAGGHFATCVVAHLRPDGVMHISNAGHLPPYHNGVALDLPGSLPLGITSDTRYDVHTFHLDAADHLTFLTDGVLEARNSSGELLGFDRLAEISSLQPEAIAQAAMRHGQDDDITIVSVHLRASGHTAQTSAALQTSFL